MQTLKDYFESGKDYLEIYLTDNFHIYIDNMGSELCIELCDKNGNSVNIGSYVDIHIHTFIVDIKESIVNYLIGNYLYNHC